MTQKHTKTRVDSFPGQRAPSGVGIRTGINPVAGEAVSTFVGHVTISAESEARRTAQEAVPDANVIITR